MKIYDYDTDVIRISCYDYDYIGSNDLIVLSINLNILYLHFINN